MPNMDRRGYSRVCDRGSWQWSRQRKLLQGRGMRCIVIYLSCHVLCFLCLSGTVHEVNKRLGCGKYLLPLSFCY